MLLFLLVQYDGIHFILINHDNFEFILIFEWQHSWESETRLVTDKLGREAGPSCFWSDGLSHCQNDADCRDLSILSTCYMVKKNNASTITLWIIRFLLLVRDNRTQVNWSYPLQSSNFINIFMWKQVLLEWHKTGPVQECQLSTPLDWL